MKIDSTFKYFHLLTVVSGVEIEGYQFQVDDTCYIDQNQSVLLGSAELYLSVGFLHDYFLFIIHCGSENCVLGKAEFCLGCLIE